MPQGEKKVVVFVHGWSVSHTKTYGGLPERLHREAAEVGLDIAVREIYLGKYVSFRDEVRLEDISRAFAAAVERELSDLLQQRRRFACITHSTGGPVIRDWWYRNYATRPRSGTCPMSHLIMLAPANYGSALAQLGRSRLSRIKTWFQGVEPGTGVLDWLELGSTDAWKLNNAWLLAGEDVIGARSIFPFVLTGQSIDRKLYDNLNTYTGELGSDGVVRVAAANLNATYVSLEQESASRVPGRRDQYQAPNLTLAKNKSGPRTAMRIVARKSHSGTSMGIMRSVSARKGRPKDAETVSGILACLKVASKNDYDKLCDRFDGESEEVQREERLEKEDRIVLPDTYFIHDRFSMVVFRLSDHHGYPVEDADILLTAGEERDPNRLPKGFFADRQRNSKHRGTITYFLNYDIMVGSDPIVDKKKDKVVREATTGAKLLGLRIIPRPGSGFVHYLPCELHASSKVLRSFLKPNQTTLVDIVLRRVVREAVFRLDRGLKQRSFKGDPPGPPIA